MPGPAPKPQDRRRRRNAPALGEARTIHRDGKLRGPTWAQATKGITPPGGEWLPHVREWYETWRAAPQAALFEGTDWQRLKALTVVVQQFYRSPSSTALGEIRLSEERWGATVTDRLRARMQIESPEITPEPSAQDAAATRERLSSRLAADTG